ncbi:hypothetical protein [Olivibacter sitiensis]|uniref:hypothetical protein n=1 Tax=Olivibacter sitiensis TaxID=376470 RepID=UPI000485DFB0|nr:hypothetical protein [Olivibacter sitiensis]
MIKINKIKIKTLGGILLHVETYLYHIATMAMMDMGMMCEDLDHCMANVNNDTTCAKFFLKILSYAPALEAIGISGQA